MSARDEIRIRFVKPNDATDEGELEGSSNLTLVGTPKSAETLSHTPSSQSLPEGSKLNASQSKLRLRVSELSMKLAQHVQEKCSSTSEERPAVASASQPVAKVDRLKRIALDVSQKVQVWSLEQQKLAGVHGDAIPKSDGSRDSESDGRVRSSSCSEKPRASDDNFLFLGETGTLANEEIVSRGIEATQIDDTGVSVDNEDTVRIPSTNRLKSISFNEGLAQICSNRLSNSLTPSLESSSAKTPTSAQPYLSAVAEHLESDTTLNLSVGSSELTDFSSQLTPDFTGDVPVGFAGEMKFLRSNHILAALQLQLQSLCQYKFFPAIVLAIGILFLRFLGVADMLIGTIVGTYVTWFLFVRQPQNTMRSSSGNKNDWKATQSTISQSNSKTQYNSALMHVAYSYNPCNFRLRQSFLGVVTLHGTSLRIGILDRKSVKEAKTKFTLNYSPSPDQFESLQFSEQFSFDLLACSVSLSPISLAKKRYFNKKYPILISRNDTDVADQVLQSSGILSVNPEVFLFTLSMREKECWFTVLSAAAHGVVVKPFDLLPIKRVVSSVADPTKERIPEKRDVVRLSKLRTSVSTGNIGEEAAQSNDSTMDSDGPLVLKPSGSKSKDADSFYHWQYVTRREQLRWFLSQATALAPSSPVAWFNAFAWRMFFEIMTVEDLKQQLQAKLQSKLTKILLPRIIEPLRLSEMDLGHRMPLFRSSEPPVVDDRGLWFTFVVEYDGGLQGTIETRLNLLKAKADDRPNSATSPSPTAASSGPAKTPDLRYLDILASESAESCSSGSESDDESEQSSTQSHNSGHLIERLTNSRYFARLIAIGSVGRAAERVSLVPLTLRIEVNRIVGRMRINMPPPPSDRIWIGFSDEGLDIDLALRPKVGNVELSGRTLHPIVSYLERKIVAEFKKKLVLPSMDDFYLGFFRDSVVADVATSEPLSDTNNVTP